MPKKQKSYKVITSDVGLFFQFDRLYDSRYLEKSFRKVHPAEEIFPGLILELEDGTRVRPVLKLELEPLEE